MIVLIIQETPYSVSSNNETQCFFVCCLFFGGFFSNYFSCFIFSRVHTNLPWLSLLFQNVEEVIAVAVVHGNLFPLTPRSGFTSLYAWPAFWPCDHQLGFTPSPSRKLVLLKKHTSITNTTWNKILTWTACVFFFSLYNAERS